METLNLIPIVLIIYPRLIMHIPGRNMHVIQPLSEILTDLQITIIAALPLVQLLIRMFVCLKTHSVVG